MQQYKHTTCAPTCRPMCTRVDKFLRLAGYGICIFICIRINFIYCIFQICSRKAGDGLLIQQQQQQLQEKMPVPSSIEVMDDDWDLLPLAADDGDLNADATSTELDDFFVDHFLSKTPAGIHHEVAVPILVGAPVLTPPTPVKQFAAADNRWAPTTMVHYDWGKRHPLYGKDVKRAAWSDEEKAWIRDWIKAHPDQPTGHAKCLQDIRADPAARAIFHTIHTFDGARLRAGFEAVMRSVV